MSEFFVSSFSDEAMKGFNTFANHNYCEAECYGTGCNYCECDCHTDGCHWVCDTACYYA